MYRIVHVICLWCKARTIAAPFDKLYKRCFCVKLSMSFFFFFICQTVNFSKVGQSYWFLFSCFLRPFQCCNCHILLYVCHFCPTLGIILSSEIVCLLLKSQCPRNPDRHLFQMSFLLVFFEHPLLGFFWTPLLFLGTVWNS